MGHFGPKMKHVESVACNREIGQIDGSKFGSATDRMWFWT